MKIFTPSLIIHITTSALLLSVALLFFFKTPSTVNPYLGYRTSKSMMNNDTWNEANTYSSKVLLITTGVLILLQVVLIKFLGLEKSILYYSILLVVALISIIPLTERQLNKTFDSDGIRIEKVEQPPGKTKE